MKKMMVILAVIGVSAQAAQASLICQSLTGDGQRQATMTIVGWNPVRYEISVVSKSRNVYSAIYEGESVGSRNINLHKVVDYSTWEDMPTSLHLQEKITIVNSDYLLTGFGKYEFYFKGLDCQYSERGEELL